MHGTCGALVAVMTESERHAVVPLCPERELDTHEASPQRLDYVARDRILKLLSVTELAQVSSVESIGLASGDEYLDLRHLEHGVRRVPVTADAAPRMLPRSAVSDETWRKILAVLGVMGAASV